LVQKFQDNFNQYDRGDEVVKNAGPTTNKNQKNGYFP
jgi:hypothetical protein